MKIKSKEAQSYFHKLGLDSEIKEAQDSYNVRSLEILESLKFGLKRKCNLFLEIASFLKNRSH